MKNSIQTSAAVLAVEESQSAQDGGKSQSPQDGEFNTDRSIARDANNDMNWRIAA
jgi:hypothetical protein